MNSGSLESDACGYAREITDGVTHWNYSNPLDSTWPQIVISRQSWCSHNRGSDPRFGSTGEPAGLSAELFGRPRLKSSETEWKPSMANHSH